MFRRTREQGLEKLAKGKLPLRARMLIDYSASVAQSKLEEAMVKAVDGITADLARFPKNLISRAMFAHDLVEVDGFDWVSPKDVTIAGSYVADGELTLLDNFLLKELNRQAARATPESGYIDVLLVATDGRNNGPEQTARIQQYTTALVTRAAREGGFAKASAAVWYWGIGLSQAHHRLQAKRYGIPDEWITWSDAIVEEVQYTSSGIGASMAEISEMGEGTVIGAPRRPRP